jgi:hypothetical protein
VKIIATIKNGKARILVNGKAIRLASDGKSAGGKNRYAIKNGKIIGSIYGNENDKATLTPDGKSPNGNKFAVKDGKMMAFVNIAKRGHEFTIK